MQSHRPSTRRLALTSALMIGLAAPAAASSGALPTEHLRIATYNVKAIDPGTSSFTALVDVIERIDADVVLLQEVGDNSQTLSQSQADSQVAALATAAGYTFRATATTSGTLSGGLRNAVISKYQVTQILSHSATEIAGSSANDITRDILQVGLDVPDTDGPVAVFNVHLKSGFGDVNEFRRAVEMQRLEKVIVNWCGQNPDGHAFVGGDFNTNVDSFSPDVFSFGDYLDFDNNGSLPQTYNLGNDIAFPLVFNPFAQLQALAGCTETFDYAEATSEDSTSNTGTFSSGSRLDYMFAEQGAPFPASPSVVLLADEVYRSTSDDGVDDLPAGNYLPKYGSGPLSGSAAGNASDHFPLVGTYRIEGPDGSRLGLNTVGQYALAPYAGYRGDLAIGSSNFELVVQQARPSQLALAFVGIFQFPPIDLGTLLPTLFAPGTFFYSTADLISATVTTDAKGEGVLPLPIPNDPALAGVGPFYTQWVTLDVDAALGFATTSDAYIVQF